MSSISITIDIINRNFNLTQDIINLELNFEFVPFEYHHIIDKIIHSNIKYLKINNYYSCKYNRFSLFLIRLIDNIIEKNYKLISFNYYDISLYTYSSLIRNIELKQKLTTNYKTQILKQLYLHTKISKDLCIYIVEKLI